ncbi:MAG: hypothetical protein K6G52_06870 [Treponemataceae bacterium]|nr:hypothetical protein [Treponemataceae bacterium]
MRVFSWSELDDLAKFCFSQNKNSALTVGGFDGPHLGHKSLFDSVLQKEDFLHGVVTFDFTDEYIKHKREFLGELSTVKQKLEVFENLGFDFCLMIDFSSNFSKIKGIDFLKMLGKSCSMQFLAIGTDFRCGYKLDTGVAEISAYSKQVGLELAVCDSVLFDGKRISSSDIRQCIKNADFSTVDKLLVFPFYLDVSEIRWLDSSFNQGEKIAHRNSFQVLPKNGAYNVKAICSDKAHSFSTVLYVESDFLRLEIPLGQDFEPIQKITFVY